MENVVKIKFEKGDEQLNDLLIASLSEHHYYAFQEEAGSLHAYINEKDLDKALLNEYAVQFNVAYDEEIIGEKNWNEQWESEFQPVVVNQFAAVRANFHSVISDVKHDLIITPKMSFGTGHHATTYLMIEQMEHINFEGKKVFDYGTGTGVLAILAEQLGGSITAMDMDDWSIINTLENIEANDCKKINVEKGYVPKLDEKYDVILANINTHVLLENVNTLASAINKNGYILLSGFLTKDVKSITDAYQVAGYVIQNNREKEGWHSILMKFCKV